MSKTFSYSIHYAVVTEARSGKRHPWWSTGTSPAGNSIESATKVLKETIERVKPNHDNVRFKIVKITQTSEDVELVSGSGVTAFLLKS